MVGLKDKLFFAPLQPKTLVGMMRVGVIADDLTGALDTGVQFSSWGLKVVVLAGEGETEEASGADVIVLNTESRESSPEEAYGKVHRAADRLTRLGVSLLYKKVDSTLRGNLGAELDAVMDASDSSLAFAAPAYPAYGRTTVDGVQMVEGKPLNETEYGIEAHIPSLLGRQSRRKNGLVKLETLRTNIEAVRGAVDGLVDEGAEVIIFDALTERDLISIGKSAEDVMVFLGSAGLASELPQGLGLMKPKPTLTICGSTRSLVVRQAQRLYERLGCEVIKLDASRLFEEQKRESEITRCVDSSTLSLGASVDVVIGSAFDDLSVEKAIKTGADHGYGEAQVRSMVEEALGEVASRVLCCSEVSGIVMTGGATALSVCRALGVENIEIVEEVEPGIPLLVLGGGLRAVTKAGGFGGDDTLLHIVKRLRRLRR